MKKVETFDLAIQLLEEVREWHRDPDSSDYNECDDSECFFCEQAMTAILALEAILEEKC